MGDRIQISGLAALVSGRCEGGGEGGQVTVYRRDRLPGRPGRQTKRKKMKMIPYTPSLETPTHYSPSLLLHGRRIETRGQMESRGIRFERRANLDGMIHDAVGPAFESVDFDEPGIFCEQTGNVVGEAKVTGA